MVINYINTDFTLVSGSYYSLPFRIEARDTLMTIECALTGNGSVVIQQSIDDVTWFDVTNTSFTCSPMGQQSYVECQPELLFRLKSSTEFITAKILI